jgi:hypothetical protein
MLDTNGRRKPEMPTDERRGRHDRESKLVESNGSGASGTVTLTATDDGHPFARPDAGVFHLQHIHGSGHGGDFTCPTLKKNDTDGDGVLTNEEGWASRA